MPLGRELESISRSILAPDQIIERIAGLRRPASGAIPIQAINVHTCMEARRSPAYRHALDSAAIAFVDGVPIRWLLKAAGLPAPPRIHGADLMALLIDRFPEARHYFYGSTPEVLGALQAALRRRSPAIRISGAHSPPFRKGVHRESPEMIERLNAASIDILWVALGAPKQELWAHLHRNVLKIPVIACVGAAFEIHAGRFSRAPRWMQSLGFEWAWRFLQDPWRLWRRYFATNGAFLVLLVQTWIRTRLGLNSPHAPTAPPGSSSAGS